MVCARSCIPNEILESIGSPIRGHLEVGGTLGCHQGNTLDQRNGALSHGVTGRERPLELTAAEWLSCTGTWTGPGGSRIRGEGTYLTESDYKLASTDANQADR